MDHQSQATSPSTSTAAPPPAQPPPSHPSSQPPPTVSQPPSSAAPSVNPNPNSTQLLKPSTSSVTTPPNRPQRPWQNPQPPHFSHFSSLSSSPSSSSVSPSLSTPPRLAIGVPASHTPPPFGQQFGLGSANSQVRPGMGMVGPMGTSSSASSGSQIRAHHQQRPSLSSPAIRPPNTSTQSFQGQGFMRPSSIASGVPPPNTSQTVHSPNQPWLTSGSQGKPPLPSPAFRPQVSSPSPLQQRSHIPQQHQSLPTNSQQQHISPAQPHQPVASPRPPDHFGPSLPPIRGPRSITQQLALQGSANPKQPTLPVVHSNPIPNSSPSAVSLPTQNRPTYVESDESCNRILSKRSIHELVSQIDPSEKLDPEVEDVLVDIADEFVESITAFGCSLAKHRKSDTLEVKDILLHLERNWNMTLPGFSADEIKTYRKPLTSDIHKERIALVRKSVLASDMAGAKSSAVQVAGNAKGNLTRTPANAIFSPNLKT